MEKIALKIKLIIVEFILEFTYDRQMTYDIVTGNCVLQLWLMTEPSEV